jgi:hypothetical protein
LHNIMFLLLVYPSFTPEYEGGEYTRNERRLYNKDVVYKGYNNVKEIQ